MNNKKKNTSFTLIELLVVIVIIGILAGVIMITTTSSIYKANFAKSQIFAENIQNNLTVNLISEWHYDDYFESGGKYYTTDSQGGYNGWLGLTNCSPGNDACPTFYNNASKKCVENGCFYFDGVDDAIYYSKDPYPNPGTITISGWVNLSSQPSQSVAQFFGMYWSDGTGIRIYSNGARFSIYDTSATSRAYGFPEALSLNEWHFIGGSYNHQTKEIFAFLDGRIYTPTPQNTYEVRQKTGYILSTGRADSSVTIYWPLHGYVDELSYYNSVLSSSQIKQNYIAGLNSMLANENISKQDYNERIELLGKK